MADVAAGAVLLLIATLVVVVAVRTYNRGTASGRRQTRNTGAWALAEHTDEDVAEHPGIAVYCEHSADERLFVGSVRWDDPDFEYEIEEVRALGQQKLAALNSPKRKRAI